MAPTGDTQGAGPDDLAEPIRVRPLARLRWPCLPSTARPGERFQAYGGEVVEVDADGFGKSVRMGGEREA